MLTLKYGLLRRRSGLQATLPSEDPLAADTLWEREKRFCRQSLPGFISHTPGQAHAQEESDYTKWTLCFLVLFCGLFLVLFCFGIWGTCF